MFERFTDDARRVIVLAQEGSRLLSHDYIGTEHILLGLLGEGAVPSRSRQPTAKLALASLGVTLDAARSAIREIVGEGDGTPAPHIPFTPRAKQVLALSVTVALERDDERIGTGDLLLGLVREGNGIGLQVLERLGARPDQVQAAVDRVWAERRSGLAAPAIRLRPMRGEEWDAWHTWAVTDYADDMVRNEALDRERALAQAAEETDALLTDGLATPGHHLFVAEDEATGRRVGHLWFGPRIRNPDPAVAWLYDIFVEEADRGRGVGRAMLDLFEAEARAGGHHRVELNVFGDNAPARHLYDSVGYVEMARQLGKDLDT